VLNTEKIISFFAENWKTLVSIRGGKNFAKINIKRKVHQGDAFYHIRYSISDMHVWYAVTRTVINWHNWNLVWGKK
jgi:hypothetical protein